MPYNYIKRIFSLILAMAVIAVSTLTFVAPSFVANFSDIEDHWAKSYV
jgi:hypothetical protein